MKKGPITPGSWRLSKRSRRRQANSTIAHAAIPHAKMPAMTMTFPVRDVADLTAHKVGDRVSVQVGEEGGAIKIVHVMSAKR